MSSRGVDAAPLHAGGAKVVPRRAASAADVRAGYHRRLDELVTRMADAFRDVVASGEVRDRASNARAEFQAQVEAGNLVKAAEGLLRLISELKIAAVVQEVTETNREVAEMRTMYEFETRRAVSELGTLRDNVAATLTALEKHYYSSQARLPKE